MAFSFDLCCLLLSEEARFACSLLECKISGCSMWRHAFLSLKGKTAYSVITMMRLAFNDYGSATWWLLNTAKGCYSLY